MAFFVGGQLFLVAAVIPSLRAEVDRARLRSIARRFGWGTLAAIAVLIGTGIPLASHFHQWGSSTLHVKLGFLLVGVVLIVWHLRRPQTHAVEGGIFLGSLAIAWLGLAGPLGTTTERFPGYKHQTVSSAPLASPSVRNPESEGPDP